MSKCKNCDGDGWVEILDPYFSGAVLGVMDCQECGGTGDAEQEPKYRWNRATRIPRHTQPHRVTIRIASRADPRIQ